MLQAVARRLNSNTLKIHPLRWAETAFLQATRGDLVSAGRGNGLQHSTSTHGQAHSILLWHGLPRLVPLLPRVSPPSDGCCSPKFPLAGWSTLPCWEAVSSTHLLASRVEETAGSSSVFGPHKPSPQLSFLYSRSPVLDINPTLPLQSGCGRCRASVPLCMGWKQCPGVPWGSHTSHFQTNLYVAVADFSSPN